MTYGALRFRLLGPLQMSADGTDLPLDAAKQRAVLALLQSTATAPLLSIC